MKAFLCLFLNLHLIYLLQVLLQFFYNILLRFLLKLLTILSAFIYFPEVFLQIISEIVLFPAPEIPVIPIICIYLTLSLKFYFFKLSKTLATAFGTNFSTFSPALYNSITILDDKYPRFPALK